MLEYQLIGQQIEDKHQLFQQVQSSSIQLFRIIKDKAIMNSNSSFLIALTVIFVMANCRPQATLVSGFWDVGRGDLGGGFKRSNKYYLGFFQILLRTESNMIIFGDQILEKFVKERRNQSNTVFILKDLKSFYQSWHTKMILKIISKFKNTPSFWKQNGRLPQYGLEMYNPVVMSKLFLMTEAIKHDIFDSDFFIWADAGLMHNYQKIADLFITNNVLESFHHIYQLSWYFHLYQDKNMFRGYEKGEFRYLDHKVPYNEVVWANYFGGRIEAVTTIASVYQNFLRITLENGDMGTEQSVFSIMLVRFPFLLPIVYDFQMRGLKNQRHSILSSEHLLHQDRHRIFRIKKDGEFEFMRLKVKKDMKSDYVQWQTPQTINKYRRQEQNKSESTPISMPLPQIQYFSSIQEINAMLSSEVSSYKYVFLHRCIFILILLTLSEYLSRLSNLCESAQQD